MMSEAWFGHALRMADIYDKHDMPERAAEWRSAHDTLRELNTAQRSEEVGPMQPSG